jgi:hypothetical protein
MTPLPPPIGIYAKPHVKQHRLAGESAKLLKTKKKSQSVSAQEIYIWGLRSSDFTG